KALSQWAIRHKADAKFLKGRYHFLLRGSCPKRIFALQGSDRLNCVRTTDCLHACFRETEMLDLALLNQILYGSCHIFDWHVRVYTVLIKQVDFLDLEPLERAFHGQLDVLRSATQARRTGTSIATTQIEPE